MKFQGLSVAVVPPKKLGDVTLYLHLAWQFHQAGAQVRFFSNLLFPAQGFFNWLQIERLEGVNLHALVDGCDLVIAYFNHLTNDPVECKSFLDKNNIAYVTAKKLPKNIPLVGRDVTVAGQCFKAASMPFCLDSRAGLSMRDWVDRYVETVYGIPVSDSLDMLCPSLRGKAGNRVLIFPTSPNSKKNYSASGFRRLALSLRKHGWQIEIIGLPCEHDELKSLFTGFPVFSFTDLRELMAHMASATAVIANDSGGGHLGSMMGLRTFTIARRHERFVWRPGFNASGMVLAPRFRFKWLNGGYIWRPFVPVGRIVDSLGNYETSSAALPKQAGGY
ncbi:MAG: ADP-heptose--LPS heptosyltransferase [Gammaproteobacteria bacterium]|nr:ADP-heptose--LPS heptosyltransferase [Gammaproteobacteria bacterium]MBU2154857.1 ADP-heptose--LPS heptosyltransferase [Gammaproteobacteria bacterium]MBU2255640.1 ADP-heptose--LPS heptosyltransferase [Gammaproteobacteria bacterium]MBU2296542.1 ADP-heptose--LPS heptosyltransferase [Gammaproteobacteria bacterium]